MDEERRGLTHREEEVLTLLREGKPNKLIAYELRMSENTVKVHVCRIIKKLHVMNRTEAAYACKERAGTPSIELSVSPAG
jgi:DNA-binding NarL/FixJ family response regulator